MQPIRDPLLAARPHCLCHTHVHCTHKTGAQLFALCAALTGRGTGRVSARRGHGVQYLHMHTGTAHRWGTALGPRFEQCVGVLGVLHKVLGVLHKVLGVLHKVLGVLHRVLGAMVHAVRRGTACAPLALTGQPRP